VARGRLRIYLGAAPGVGKTVAMLAEGRRRRDRGTDVVVGLLETHGRAYTAGQAEGLEIVPRRSVEHRGTSLTELDVDAVLTRAPEVALVDELAHTNAPSSPRTKRWEDIETLLDAGIDVISTVNIQHLESLNDVVEAITGVVQRETVPDDVVRSADQIELVDMSPESLRRRMSHGNIYPADRIDAALSNYFRPGNLSALRELALLWLADRVDETLESYRASHGISVPWPTRERIVVAVTGGPESETVLRRAAQIASRGAGSELLACHVSRPDGLVDADPETLAAQRKLVKELGGVMHEVAGSDIAESILDVARGVNATQIVLGTSRRSGLARLTRRGVGEQVAAGSGDIDVHLVSHSVTRVARLRWGDDGLGQWRRWGGWLLATVGVALVTLALLATPGRHELPLEVLLFLALTVATALAGGLLPALCCAVVSSLVINWFFTDPRGTLTIQSPQNALALVVFVVVAAAVASVVHRAARRRDAALRAQRESRVLAALAQSLLAEAEPLPALLERARATFGMRGAALVSRPTVRDPWTLVASAGEFRLDDVADASVRQTVDDETELVLLGPILPADDQRLVVAFSSHAAALLTRERLAAEAGRARGLARDNRARTALLAAVSHDLRTPLAGIKAAVSSLRQSDVTFSPEDEAQLLESVEESADRLGILIGNLLDMSRIQTGSITPHVDDLALEDVVEAARAPLVGSDRVRTRFDDDIPLVRADAGLLDRVLANVLENALRHSPGRREVVVQAGRFNDRVQIRVVDRGPGVSDAAKDQIFAPFQRGGDVPRGDGVGLGLAVARGLTEAMDGSLWAEDTPGGGLTIAVDLPMVPAAVAPSVRGSGS
jgi:two-component system sensor histidine kinase KdpD